MSSPARLALADEIEGNHHQSLVDHKLNSHTQNLLHFEHLKDARAELKMEINLRYIYVSE